MALRYLPFFFCTQIVAASRNAPPLSRGARSAGVKLLQAGLKQLGYSLPHSSLAKGIPDGIFGKETVAAVKRFQEKHDLKADGVAGKDTIWLMDSLLAASWKTPPAPLAPKPRIPMTVEYQLGSADPPYTPDVGAGAWKSSPTQAGYAALAASVVASLPFAYGIIGDDAAKHMLHYFLSSGATYEIDLEGMVRDVPSAFALYEDEVAQAKEFVELLPPGRHEITSRHTQEGYNKQAETRNWYFALGGYHAWGRGSAVVTDSGIGRNCELDFTYHLRDRYNWDNGKSVNFRDIVVTDEFMAEFHRQGLAREFDCVGAIRRRFVWKSGAPISRDQLQTSSGRV